MVFIEILPSVAYNNNATSSTSYCQVLSYTERTPAQFNVKVLGKIYFFQLMLIPSTEVIRLDTR